MWDGAINHLDMQALAPTSHPDEMGEKIEDVIRKMQRSKHISRYLKKHLAIV